MIRHIVALRFRPDVSVECKVNLYRELAALQGHLEGILDFQAGPNISVEPLSRGFADLFWLDFRDTAARDTYLIDPTHQAIGARIVAQTEGGPEGVFVFDIDVP